MKTDFTEDFSKELEKITVDKIKQKVYLAILNVESANSLNEIINFKKLSGYKNAYRIKIGDYRIGIVVVENTVLFVRVKHRKDIYKLFP